MSKSIVRDSRESGVTEMDARGQFLAPDASVRIATVRQVDGGVRSIYAHTQRQAREWRGENADAIPSSVIALIVDDE